MNDENMSRRKALGIVSASAVAAGLTSCSSGGASKYSKDALTQKTEEILEFATSQSFMNELKAVLDTPKERQLEEAARRFAPERLAQLGLKLPPNTRISSREFDESSAKARVLGLSPVPGSMPSPMEINLSVPRASLSREHVLAAINKDTLLENREVVAAGICVCVGAGGCLGVGA